MHDHLSFPQQPRNPALCLRKCTCRGELLIPCPRLMSPTGFCSCASCRTRGPSRSPILLLPASQLQPLTRTSMTCTAFTCELEVNSDLFIKNRTGFNMERPQHVSFVTALVRLLTVLVTQLDTLGSRLDCTSSVGSSIGSQEQAVFRGCGGLCTPVVAQPASSISCGPRATNPPA